MLPRRADSLSSPRRLAAWLTANPPLFVWGGLGVGALGVAWLLFEWGMQRYLGFANETFDLALYARMAWVFHGWSFGILSRTPPTSAFMLRL